MTHFSTSCAQRRYLRHRPTVPSVYTLGQSRVKPSFRRRPRIPPDSGAFSGSVTTVKKFSLADDTPLGINKGSSYFFAYVDPGTRP